MENLRAELKELKDQLTGDFFKDMETHDKIMAIEIKLGLRVKNNNGSYFQCENCGS